MKRVPLARKNMGKFFENLLLFRSKIPIFMSGLLIFFSFSFSLILFKNILLPEPLPQKPVEETIPEEIKNEILLWEKVTQDFSEFKDAYLKLAILNWKVSRITDSQKYLEKAKALDPNSPVVLP